MFDSEMAVIGSILIDARCLPEVRGEVSASDFQTEAGRAVFAAACALADDKQPIDPVTIKMKAAELGRHLDNNTLVSAMELSDIASNIPVHLRGMRDSGLRAELLDAINSAQIRLMQDEPPDLVCADLRAQLEKSAENSNTVRVISSEEAILEFMDYRIQLENGNRVAFLSTGFDDLDDALGGGFVPQSLNILAARPGCGKTTFGLQIAEAVAAAGVETLFISLEMPNKQLTARRLAVDSGISAGRLLNGNLYDDEAAKMAASADKLHKAPLHFNRVNRAGVGDIGVMARQVKNCGFVVVDYLGLLNYEPGKTLYEQVTKTSNALKQLAMHLGIPILCLCQLNREVEKRKGTPPMMSDLRDSGAVEQDADSILMLHQPGDRVENGPTALNCYVRKNRHGPAGGELNFNWYMKSGRIRPMLQPMPGIKAVE